MLNMHARRRVCMGKCMARPSPSTCTNVEAEALRVRARVCTSEAEDGTTEIAGRCLGRFSEPSLDALCYLFRFCGASGQTQDRPCSDIARARRCAATALRKAAPPIRRWHQALAPTSCLPEPACPKPASWALPHAHGLSSCSARRRRHLPYGATVLDAPGGIICV
jgi:hypothetical protein